MQVNTGKRSDMHEIQEVLKRNDLTNKVVASVEFDPEDNLLVNLQGPQAEAARTALETYTGWNSPHAVLV